MIIPGWFFRCFVVYYGLQWDFSNGDREMPPQPNIEKVWAGVIDRAIAAGGRAVRRFPAYLRGELPGTILHETRQTIEGIPEYAKATEAFVRGKDVKYTPSMVARGLEMASMITGGGMPGGLPAGAVGVGITKKEALEQLTRGAFEEIAATGGGKSFQPMVKEFAGAMKKVVKGLASTAEESLIPIERMQWSRGKPTWRGYIDPKTREIGLNPKEVLAGTLPHEGTHAGQIFPEEVFEKMSPGRKIIAAEAADLRKALQGKHTGGQLTYAEAYDIDPTEIHAKHMSWIGKKSASEYDRIFWENFNRAVTFSRRAAKQVLGSRGPEPKYYPFE